MRSAEADTKSFSPCQEFVLMVAAFVFCVCCVFVLCGLSSFCSGKRQMLHFETENKKRK